MIHLNTIIEVGDNSGAQFVKCVNTTKGKSNSARIGDIIRVSIYKNNNAVKVIKKKKIYKALVINSTHKKNKLNGIYQKWNKSRVLILSDNLGFLGTKVYGSISKEIKIKKKKKEGTFRSAIISYARSYG